MGHANTSAESKGAHLFYTRGVCKQNKAEAPRPPSGGVGF